MGCSVCVHKKRRYSCVDCNPRGHLAARVRGQVSYHMRNRGLSKDNHSIDYVGCSVDELWEHLSVLCCFYNSTKKYGDFVFVMETMNFDVDHFLPLMPDEPLDDDEFHRRLHWTNLRPMPGPENIAKRNHMPSGPTPLEEREAAAFLSTSSSK